MIPAVATTAYTGCRAKVPSSTRNSLTNVDIPGSASDDSPMTRKTPPSTGATFATPP